MSSKSSSLISSLDRLRRDVVTRIGSWRARRADDPALNEARALADLRAATPRLRWEAAAALGRHPQRSPEALAALVSALADAEPFVRWQAAEALARQESGRVFPVLIATLNAPDPLRRVGAAEALGRTGGEAACLELHRYASDPDPRMRAAIATALGACGDLTAVQALQHLLADGAPEVQRAAARALGILGDPKTAAPLAGELAQPDQPLLVRRALAAALTHAAHPDAQPALLQALNDADPQVRGYAAQALGQIGSEAAHGPLAAAGADATRLLRGSVGDRARRALELLERRGRRVAPATPPNEAH